jgi:uncharacterized protein YndB with AHSA1/START domain
MWTTQETIETTARPEDVWALWEDVAGWPRWNAGVERAELSGSFAPGGTITMHPPGQDPIELTIVEAVEPERFVDQAELGPIVVRTEHRSERIDGGRLRVVYRMEITGPPADTMGPEIGPQITADFPDVLRALAERASS